MVGPGLPVSQGSLIPPPSLGLRDHRLPLPAALLPWVIWPIPARPLTGPAADARPSPCSRGVLNEQDILEYILSRYNVTLHVTTFQEPLLEVMQLFARTDVLIGMHGAGWTNGIFIKHGATCLQMFPYGWRLPDGRTIRGHNYREIVLASETQYLEWVNPRWDHAFFRRQDFQKRWK